MAGVGRLAQAGLELVQLRGDLGRQLVAERGQVLLDLLELGRELVLVDGQQLLQALVGDVEAVRVQLAGAGTRPIGVSTVSPSPLQRRKM